MKKIPSLFKDYDSTAWVLNGEGIPTVKMDGTACLIEKGKLYKRYDCKRGRKPPACFRPCEDKPDEVTGHWPGWVPVGDGPEDAWHREGLEKMSSPEDGTYELVGPSVQGNPYGATYHFLVKHGSQILLDNPRTFEEIRECLLVSRIEGIVWHHPDGRMAKIKRKDFGFLWPPREGFGPPRFGPEAKGFVSVRE